MCLWLIYVPLNNYVERVWNKKPDDHKVFYNYTYETPF